MHASKARIAKGVLAAVALAALIVEPLVQGASGMRMYDARYLALARDITARHGVHLIADEGWKLLALYRFDPDSGLWQHRAGAPDPPSRRGGRTSHEPHRRNRRRRHRSQSVGPRCRRAQEPPILQRR